MSNTYFHNSKLANENKDKKKLPQIIALLNSQMILCLLNSKTRRKKSNKTKNYFFLLYCIAA